MTWYGQDGAQLEGLSSLRAHSDPAPGAQAQPPHHVLSLGIGLRLARALQKGNRSVGLGGRLAVAPSWPVALLTASRREFDRTAQLL